LRGHVSRDQLQFDSEIEKTTGTTVEGKRDQSKEQEKNLPPTLIEIFK